MSAAGGGEAWTIRRLLTWTQDYFKQREIESPRLCAEILLAHALQTERLRLYTRFDEEPAAPARDRFRELVKEAAGGKPIAYLTGVKEFYSLTFEVTPDVLIPRPETEILVERTISILRSAPTPPAILDLCTGSGCIAIALAKHLATATVFASDIAEPAVAVARRNAARHGVAERIDFRAGDLFAPWQAGADPGQTFDVVVSNPPYIADADPLVEPGVRDHEPRGALFAGADGLDVIRRVLAEAPRWLNTGGHLLMEIGYDQAAAVRSLAAAEVWTGATTYRDGGGHERVLHVRRAS